MYGRPTPAIPPLEGDTNYQKVLFLPGRRLQPRELQLVQSIPTQWMGKILSSLWGYASPLSGLEITISSGWIQISPGTFGAYIPSLPGWLALDCPGYAAPVPPSSPTYWICLSPNEPLYQASQEDPSLGGPPLATLGGYGCHLSFYLSLNEYDGYPLAYVEGGRVFPVPRTESLLRDYWEDEINRRAWDELGDCILSGLYIQESPQSLLISPGKALIRGSLVNIDSIQLMPFIPSVGAPNDIYLSESGRIFSRQEEEEGDPFTFTPRRVSSDGVPIHVSGCPLYIYEVSSSSSSMGGFSEYSILLAHRVDGRWETPLRLPSLNLLYEELQAILNPPLTPLLELDADIYHPAFDAYRGVNYWTLPHSVDTIDIPGRNVPHTLSLHAWQHRITETNLVPQSGEPWIRKINSKTLAGYNLLPLTSYPPLLSGAPSPSTSFTIKIGEADFKASPQGTLLLEASVPIPDGMTLGSHGVSKWAPLDRGIGQSFSSPPLPIAISRVSFWAATSFSGIVSVTDCVAGLPTGFPLISVPISVSPPGGGGGWINIDLPYPVYIAGAFCLILSTSDVNARVGVYNPVLPTLSILDPNPTEGGGSSHLVLSTSGSNAWTDIRHRDMCWRIYKAVISSTTNSITLPLLEVDDGYDGLDVELPTYAPPGTSLQYIWKSGEDIISDLTSIGGADSLSLSFSMDSLNNIPPAFLGGSINLWKTSLTGTWVSITREEPSIYTNLIVRLHVYLPPNTSMVPYASANGGQSWHDLSPSIAPYAGGSDSSANSTVLFWRAEDLPPAAAHYDVTGNEYMAYRTTVKIKVEMKTAYSHIRPLLYGVEVITS